MVLGKKHEELTLSLLGELLKGQQEHAGLLEVSKKLLDTVEQLKITNETNRTLVTMSLDYIDFNMNLLREAGQQGDDMGMFEARQ